MTPQHDDDLPSDDITVRDLLIGSAWGAAAAAITTALLFLFVHHLTS